MEKTMNFADRLKLLRQEEGISQEKLGEILNLGKSAVFSYEKQGRQPNFRTLIAMSAHFGVSIDYLLGVTDIRDRYTEEEAALLQDAAGRAFLEYWHSLPDKEKQCLHAFLRQLSDLTAK